MLRFGNIITCEQPVGLAPMENISDPPFRKLCAKYEADFFISEFISADGLLHNAETSLKKLEVMEYERPVGIQLFGKTPSSLAEAAKLAESANPDFIDLNFGCPVKKIAGKGAGAGLLKDIPLMIKICEEVVSAVQKPVTVKTRLGWDDQNKNILEIIKQLQDTGISAVTIHGRTRSQMYKGDADWSLIGQAKNDPEIHIPIIGNGDINSPESAKNAFANFNVDGIMVGRAAVGRPWIFKQIKTYLKTGVIIPEPSLKEKVEIAKQHFLDSIKWKGEKTAIFEMRPHYSNYFKRLPDFKKTRIRLITETNPNKIISLLEKIPDQYSNE